jgi:hypothetical protein
VAEVEAACAQTVAEVRLVVLPINNTASSSIVCCSFHVISA